MQNKQKGGRSKKEERRRRKRKRAENTRREKKTGIRPFNKDDIMVNNFAPGVETKEKKK